MNCYLPMPFSSHARITLENQHPGDIRGFFFQIDCVLLDEPQPEAGYFHAQWRRQKLTELQNDYVIADCIRGRGHYVGTHLMIQALERYWWGEGEVKFYRMKIIIKNLYISTNCSIITYCYSFAGINRCP